MELLDENKNIIGTKRLTKANEQTHHLFDFDIKTIPKELSHDDKLETCNSQCKKVEGAKGFIMYQGHEKVSTTTDCSKITDRGVQGRECLASNSRRLFTSTVFQGGDREAEHAGLQYKQGLHLFQRQGVRVQGFP